MKYILILLSFCIFSCASKKKPPVITKSDTSCVIEAHYVVNGSTLQLLGGPVKRVIYPINGVMVDSTTTPGHVEIKKVEGVDTFYLLPNIDSTLILKDSLQRPLLDKEGRKQYQASFRQPLTLNKIYVSPTSITFPSVK